MSESNRAYRHHQSELDLFHGASTRPLSQLTILLTVAAATTSLLNAPALANWAFELPYWLGPLRSFAMELADAIVWLSEALALDRFHDGVRGLRDWLQSLSF